MGSAIDWVAITPWPGSANGTLLPTAKAWDWVATPISPVPGVAGDDRVGHARPPTRVLPRMPTRR